MAAYNREPLDDCFERVRRAGEHLAELQAGILQVRRDQANAIPIEFNPDPPHNFIRAYPSETFYGMRMGILVGEICYNLRGALDYLVFQLAKRDSRAEQKGTQFPIVDKRESFVDGINVWLRGINSAHVTAIERLQPYNGCNWTKRLRDISNPDKHRELVQHLGESDIHLHLDEGRDFARILGVQRQTLHPARGIVNVKVYIATRITFSDSAPVIDTIQEIQAGVAQTLADFKPEF